MKSIICVLLLAVSSLAAQVPRYELLRATNRITAFHIEGYEIAELVSSQGYPIDLLSVESPALNAKFGLSTPPNFQNAGSTPPIPPPVVILGPATVSLVAGGSSTAAFALFKITPGYYPIDKAAMVAPGPGGAVVELQCSADLVNWTTVTNGVWTNQPSAKFFRVHLTTIDGTKSSP